MACKDFFQPLLDYLNQPSPGQTNFLHMLAASNRSLSNRFCFFISCDLFLQTGTNTLSGRANQLFSDRQTANHQPFDQQQADVVDISLTLPDGPFVIRSPSGALIGQFGNFECRSGMFIATNNNTEIAVFSLTTDFSIIIQ